MKTAHEVTADPVEATGKELYVALNFLTDAACNARSATRQKRLSQWVRVVAAEIHKREARVFVDELHPDPSRIRTNIPVSAIESPPYELLDLKVGESFQATPYVYRRVR